MHDPRHHAPSATTEPHRRGYHALKGHELGFLCCVQECLCPDTQSDSLCLTLIRLEFALLSGERRSIAVDLSRRGLVGVRMSDGRSSEHDAIALLRAADFWGGRAGVPVVYRRAATYDE